MERSFPMRWTLLTAAVVVLAACGGADAAEWRALRPATLERTEVAAARVGDAIYVVGGFERRSGADTAAVERYDISRDRWTRVRDMPVALDHAAIAVHRGHVYVVGGYAGGRAVAGLLRYDPARDRWTRRGSMPTARGALTAGVIGDRLYAAGGAVNGQALRDARGLRLHDSSLELRAADGGRPRAPRRRCIRGARSTSSPAVHPGWAT